MGLFRWSILYLFGICLLLILSRQSDAALLDAGEGWMLMLTGGFQGWLLDLRVRFCR